MIKRYLDFELKIYSNDKEIEIDIDGRPYGFSLPERLKLPLSLQPVNYKTLTPDLTAIAAAGHSLFESVFPKAVKEAFITYLGRRREGEGVRICISTQSNVLGEWVWEILCNELNPAINFLALDPKTPVIRITRVGHVTYDRPLQLPLRMLIVLASPGSLKKIDVGLIRESLRDAFDPKLIIADYLGFDDQGGANYDSLQEKIAGQATPYDVVHIIAHGLLETGEEGQVAFTRPEDGGRQKISASSLAGLFRERGVVLVVLQSCQSGAVDPTVNSFSGVAQQLVAAGVPAVLAMQDIVEQDVAADFIGKLYKRWISAGTRFEDALTQARQSLNQKYRESIAPWAIPVFYIAPGLQLILHQPAPPADIEKTRATPLQTVATERQVDAALPKQMRLGKETDLLVLIRIPTEPGLREKLGAESRDFEATPDDVLTSPVFDVEFEQDAKSGRPLPFVVKIRIETKDFELDRTEVKVQIRPQGDSVLSIFSVTAKKKGRAKMRVSVLDTSEQEVTLAELTLVIDVRTGEAFETEYLVTETVLKPFQPNPPNRPNPPKGKPRSSKKLESFDDRKHLDDFDNRSKGSGDKFKKYILDTKDELDREGTSIFKSDSIERVTDRTGKETEILIGDYVQAGTGDDKSDNSGSTTGTATGTGLQRNHMVTGVFRDRESAERAYRALTDRGYTADDVNMMMSDDTRRKHFSVEDTDSDLSDKVWRDAGKGAAIGGTTGAILAAIAANGTALALPGLGLLVAGPLAAGLAGTAAGGVTGGLVGALVGSGIPEERAKEYERGIQEGGIVIGVIARSDEDAECFEQEFRAHGGEHVYR